MITIYLILGAILLICLLRFVSALVRYITSRLILTRIPCPPGHWLWGNVSRDLWNDTDRLFLVFRDYALRYWPIYRFETFGIATVNLLHPNDIEIVLTNMKHMKKSKIYRPLEKWLERGLVTSTGQHWQTKRKILTPAFHFSILKKFLKVFNEETEKLVDQIEKVCHNPYTEVHPLVTEMTLNVIGETAMGMNKIDRLTKEKYKDALNRLGKIIVTRLVIPWYSISQVYQFTQLYKEEVEIIDYLHNFAYKMIRLREKELLKNSKEYESISGSRRKADIMLDLLLMAKIDGSDIDLKGIREEVDTFMFAGHDTTSRAITFLLLNLANYKNIQENVYQEIIDTLGSGEPTYENLQQLKYTERVIKESLRLYPIVPFISRVAGEDFTTFTGYYIPKGTILNIHIIDLHRSPKIFPDPMKFDPDRFLPENCRHPFAYIPFSAGPRNCIGQRFSILELKAALCGILRKYTLHPVDKPSIITFHPDIILRPKTPIRIKFVPK